MKKTITILITILSFGYAQAQAPAIQWQKSLGGTLEDSGYAAQATPDGGCVLAGISKSNNGNVTGNHGGYDCWVVKLDATGTLQWQKSLGGSGSDQANAIQNTADGGYILAGSSTSNNGDVTGNHGGKDYWIIKLNATGTLQWQKCLGGSDSDAAYAVQTTSDGGYVVTGYTSSNNGDVTENNGDNDYWVVKLDATGTLQWQNSLGGLLDDQAFAIKTTSDGGYVVAGLTYSFDGDVTGNHGDYDFWIVKLDATGTLQWQKSLGGADTEEAYDIETTSDGGYIVAGNCSSNSGNVTGNHGNFDYWVVKLDATGTIQWQKSLGGSLQDKAYGIETTPDGGFILAGNTASNNGDVIGNHGLQDYWLVKLDATGTIQWQKCYGGSDNDFARTIQTTTDGGYVAAGYSFSNSGDVTGNHGSSDFWSVKLASNSLTTTTFDKNAILIYPNPVSDVLQIQTHNTTITKTKIIAVSGKVIIEQTKNSNTINVENLAKGIYIIEVSS